MEPGSAGGFVSSLRKARSMFHYDGSPACTVELALEEPDWAAQNPNLNPNQPFRDELEQARPRCHTVADLISTLVAE